MHPKCLTIGESAGRYGWLIHGVVWMYWIDDPCCCIWRLVITLLDDNSLYHSFEWRPAVSYALDDRTTIVCMICFNDEWNCKLKYLPNSCINSCETKAWYIVHPEHTTAWKRGYIVVTATHCNPSNVTRRMQCYCFYLRWLWVRRYISVAFGTSCHVVHHRMFGSDYHSGRAVSIHRRHPLRYYCPFCVDLIELPVGTSRACAWRCARRIGPAIHLWRSYRYVCELRTVNSNVTTEWYQF